MMRRRKTLGFAAGVLAVASLALGSTAQATSAAGSWWTGNKTCTDFADIMQGHYVNHVAPTGGHSTQADGYNVRIYYGYIREIKVTEYTLPSGTQYGPGRDLTFTGTATTSSTTGISTTYLPIRPVDPAVGMKMRVFVRGSAGNQCYGDFIIGQS
jgi:hypothetical protein